MYDASITFPSVWAVLHPKRYDAPMNKSKNSKSDKLGKNDYYDQLAPLQLELNDVAR